MCPLRPDYRCRQSPWPSRLPAAGRVSARCRPEWSIRVEQSRRDRRCSENVVVEMPPCTMNPDGTNFTVAVVELYPETVSVIVA